MGKGKSAAAAKPRSDQRSGRRALCQELLALRRRYSTVFLQIDDLKATLIKLATDAGEGGFREVFETGQITVSPAKAPEFKSHCPEVDVKIFDALSEVKRQKLIEAGIIKIVAQYSRQYYGRVDTKIFA